MSIKVVISQSMYFPWVGMLEQIRLADVFVHYDDVQLSRGFYNRIQVKTPTGRKWMTVPLRKHPRNVQINEALVDNSKDWRRQHLDLLRQLCRHTPYRDDMLHVAEAALSKPAQVLADVARESLMSLADYFGLRKEVRFVDSSTLGIGGSSSQRLKDIVCALGGDTYITGHGAKDYLDHELFEQSGVAVRFMDYACVPYAQQHGPFTPYVSALDLIANCGVAGSRVFQSKTVNWRQFINESA